MESGEYVPPDGIVSRMTFVRAFIDTQIFEVDAARISESQSARSLTFSDEAGLHRFYFDQRPSHVPVTLFIHNGDDVRPRIVWAHPDMTCESDF
jgi:hypothetical protein